MPRPDAPPRPHRLPRDKARLQRQFDRLRARLPWLDGWIRHLQSDRAALIRLPLALLLILGGLLSFLPVLGIWMLPLGLMLLALDIPVLRGPVSAAIIRVRRWWARRRRR
jgi:hypothetical protein